MNFGSLTKSQIEAADFDLDQPGVETFIAIRVKPDAYRSAEVFSEISLLDQPAMGAEGFDVALSLGVNKRGRK